MNSIRELMDLYGYKFIGYCNCKGYKTAKYKLGEYEFRWMTGRYKFEMKKNGRMFKNPAPVKEAESYLEELHTTKTEY